MAGAESKLRSSRVVSRELDTDGFIVIPGPVAADDLGRLSEAYDREIDAALPADVGVGSTTTRVSDFVNRGPEFDSLYVYPPLIDACRHVLGDQFKLSTMLARTLRPGTPAQKLHVDFERDASGWTMVGFIFMVDEFRTDNGATRFLPGSHLWPEVPPSISEDPRAPFPGQALACGPAGSMVVYNGSGWHGHDANRSERERRSIQGAFVRFDAPAGGNLQSRMLPETLRRISPLAKYLLGLEPR